VSSFDGPDRAHNPRSLSQALGARAAVRPGDPAVTAFLAKATFAERFVFIDEFTKSQITTSMT